MCERFKGEIGRRIHERRVDMKFSDGDNTYNVCESCDSEEDEEYCEEEEEEGEEAMEPVGKEDGDVDNDGDKDSSDKYLLKRRKAIGKAMKKEGSYGSKKSKSGGGY